MSAETNPSKQNTHEYIVMTREEFLAPITDPYVKGLTEMPIEDLIDDYNPGSTKPDGSINFECHCVSHLVASPCGHEFRQAISCQKAADESELEQGACAEEFVEFMQCVVRTKCFKKNDEDDEDLEPPTPDLLHEMDVTSKELSLKRTADGTNDSDAATPKRRNTGVIDGRKTRRSAYSNPLGGTPNDPLNLNTSGSEKTAYDRIKRLEECHVLPGAVHQRRFSFRTSHAKKQPKKEVFEDVKKEEPLDELDQIAKRKAKREKMANRYRYGNFNYFHRTQTPFQKDPRLDLMCDDWFKDKNVLDIGCNSGLLTISIAREFSPLRILGIDIDYHLVAAARKNLRHFRDKEAKLVGRFPASFPFNLGPISMPSTTTSNQFPENVWFRKENYVLDNDEQLNDVEEEYDIILAWSISKWIHLNWGDDGLKRFFKRVFKQLKPNGKFLLEPQTSRGYKKRAWKHPELKRNLKAIQFWPEQFKDYLCGEIGFVHCEELENPLIQHLGYDGPLHLYYKEQFLWQDAPMQMPIEPASISPFYNYLPSNTPRADSQSTPQHTLVFTPPQTPEDDIRYGR